MTRHIRLALSAIVAVFLPLMATAQTIGPPPGGGGGAVSSVSNSDGTLTISPTTGDIVASLDVAHANTWTAVQTITNSDFRLLGSSTGYTTFTSDNAGATNYTLHFPAADDTIVTLAATQILTGKTISGASNTLSNIGNASLTNSSMTIAGHSVSLGGTQAIACGDLSDGATGCSTAIGTSGATIPLLSGANTWSGANSFSNANPITLTSAASPNGMVMFATADQVTNYEDLRMLWDSVGSQFVIRAEKGGTGTLRAVTLHGNGIFMRPNGSGSGLHGWKFTTSGLLAETDNSDDIGASGATRPRNIYLGGFLNAGSLQLTQNVSGAGIYGTSGAYLQSSGTLTDTTSSGTVATAYGGVLGNHTWAASSATTLTKAFGIYVSAPTAGTNVTLSSKFGIGTDSIAVGDGNNSTPSIAFVSDTNTGFARTAAGQIGVVSQGSYTTIFLGDVRNGSARAYAWSSNSDPNNGGNDTMLFRDGAAGVIAQRNGTNAQSIRIYNTYTNASNNEYASLSWQTVTNTLTIGTHANGTGTARNMEFLIGGANKMDYGVTNAAMWTTPVAISSLVPVQSKTANFSVPATGGDNFHYDNTGAAGEVDFTLPTSGTTTVGQHFCFAVVAAQIVKVVANTGVTLYNGTSATTSGGNLESNSVGSVVCLYAQSTTLWLASSATGTWAAN